MIYAQHFSAEEFREWADDMSPRLVTMLDVLRFRLGRPDEFVGLFPWLKNDERDNRQG